MACANARFDVYLGRVTQIEEHIQAEALFDDRILIVTGPNSKWGRQRKKIALSELADEPWVLPQPTAAVGSGIAEAFRTCGVKFPPKGVVWGVAFARLRASPEWARFWVLFRRRCCGSAPISLRSRSCLSTCRLRPGQSEL